MKIDKKLVRVPVADLIPYENNPRNIPQEAIDDVCESYTQCGVIDPIEIDENNVILSGHTRRLAAIRLGIDEVDVLKVTGLNEKQKRKYRILANKTGEKSSWDYELLEAELEDLDFDGYDFGFDLSDFEPEDEIIEDNYDEEPPEEPVSKRGDIWQLGDHLLMVGDSTSAEDIATLMGGEQADLWLTDPPYNVNYEGTAGKIQNDNLGNAQFKAFLLAADKAAYQNMKPGAAFYIWHADSEGLNFRAACEETGLHVRECLIWVKNSFVLGRSDYQWRHEPCQPAGTMVLTPTGEVPIEQLKDGDRVVSYYTMQNEPRGFKHGQEIKTAHRHYKGLLYGVCAGGKKTWATNNHQFSVVFNANTANAWCTYIMRRGDWWRVGVTRTYDARGFGLKHRLDQEHAEEAWLVEVFQTQADAQMGEQLLATKYGIPYTHWEVDRGVKDVYRHRTKRQIDWLYDRLDLEQLAKNAERLLHDFGRDIRFPLIDKESKRQAFSRRVAARIHACNLVPNLMMVPVLQPDNTTEYKCIDRVDRKEHDGEVYSLAVRTYEHYIADGIVTHNCLYGWKEGAAHYFTDSRSESTVIPDAEEIDPKKMKKEELVALVEKILSDRLATTVIEMDKPTRNGEHPTMKPIKLFDYLIRNSTVKGDIVLDSFAGSGTTVMACEQNGRQARVMELDPKYADVIVNRWETFTGRKAKLIQEEKQDGDRNE